MYGTYCSEIRDGKVHSYYITPEEVGLKTYPMDDLIGGNGKENAEITMDILTGKEQGAKRDIVLLNSGIAFYVAGKADSIKSGVDYAKEIIDSGKAFATKEAFVALTNE